MRCLFLADCFILLLALACSPSASGNMSETGAAPTEHLAEDCPVTLPTDDPTPPPALVRGQTWRDPFPPGTLWYRSPDGKIGAIAGSAGWYRSPDGRLWPSTPTRPGWKTGGIKVPWIKPVGSSLEVSGRRLDGEAPPLDAWLSEGYPADFQASDLHFPTEGCWEVEARAEGSVLRFVVYVPR